MDQIQWTYQGEDGPDKWGELSADFVLCAEGISQSPIDISDPTPQELTNIDFHYQPSQVNILNNGHTIQVNYDPGSYIEFEGQRYDLIQYHFHAPSEHAIKGVLAAAELHFVHQSTEGKLAVVGVFLKAGAANPAYNSTFENLPAKPGPVQRLDAQVNAYDMLPEVKTTYRYVGSLTTPPCTEGVLWKLMVNPVEISPAQLEAYTRIFNGNNRPLQPLNDRTLFEDIG